MFVNDFESLDHFDQKQMSWLLLFAPAQFYQLTNYKFSQFSFINGRKNDLANKEQLKLLTDFKHQTKYKSQFLIAIHSFEKPADSPRNHSGWD